MNVVLEKSAVFSRVAEGCAEDILNKIMDPLKAAARAKTPEEKETKLRGAFNLLYRWLVEKRLSNLNPEQKTFLITGAIGDKLSFLENGQEVVIELLIEGTYEALVKSVCNIDSLPLWTEQIYTPLDRFKAIALGELAPLDPNVTVARKQPTRNLEEAKKRQDIDRKRAETLQETTQALSEVQAHAPLYYAAFSPKSFTAIQAVLKTLESYIAKVSSGTHGQSEINMEGQFSAMIQKVESVLTEQLQVVSDLKRTFIDFQGRLSKLLDCQTQLRALQVETQAQGKRSMFVAYDLDKIANIKKDMDTVGDFVVKGSQNAPDKPAMSASRILVKEQTERSANPMEESYCTVENVARALKKISRIHINLFPLDKQGDPIIPPIIIEPVAHYAEWFEDRVIVSFVSGEGARKGPRHSLTPVEMLALKACGLYLSKDPIFNYRGERNLGTFMGEYAGKIEKKAAVKWTGEQKKMTMVMDTRVMDEARREDAVRDYMEFAFSVANDFPPPSRISERKIAVLLKFVQIESLLKTCALTLKYVLPADAYESREIILTHARHSSREAKNLVEQVFHSDPLIAKSYSNDVNILLTKVFGKGSL